MKVLIVSISFIVLVSNSVLAQQKVPELPDYTKWIKTADHSEKFLYNGKEIDLRDQHYIIRQERIDYALVYFTPEDSNKMWFAIHMVLNPESGALHGFLFERKDEAWLFVQNLSNIDLNDMAHIFKARYNLDNVKK